MSEALGRSWFSSEDQPALLDFWRVYDRHFQSITEEVHAVLARHPELGPSLPRLGSEGMLARAAEVRARLSAAVASGDWAEVEADARKQGAHYATERIAFRALHDAAAALEGPLTPRIVDALRDSSERVAGAMRALHRYLHMSLAAMCEAYARTHEETLRSAKEGTESANRELRAFKLGIDRSNDAIFVTARSGAITYVNPAFERLYGFSQAEAIGKTPRILKSGTVPDAEYRQFWRTLLDKKVVAREITNKTREGRLVEIELTANPILDEREEIVGFLAIQRDVTARNAAASALRESEARFARLYEAGIIGVAVADVYGHIFDANEEYARTVGTTRQEVLSGAVNWETLTPPEWHEVDARAVEQLRTTGVAKPWEKELFRKDGTRVPVLLGVAMLEFPRCITFCIDLSERKKLEAQLLQSQKMDAIGRLAGGIAHDFNNMLSVILSYSALLVRDLKPEDPMRADLEEIRTAGERAASLTRQLLAFSRKQVLAPRAIDLNEVISQMDKMLRRLIGEDIELTTVAAHDLGVVKVDPGQMEQVIMNLVVNARDALPKGGQVTIETANVTLDDQQAKTHAGARPGPYVMLAVSDNGIGMDRATQARIFEPFFTTKEKGRGTGLGLSTVMGIVEQSGGSIWVYSEVGKGTAFKIYLPRSDALAESPVSPPRPPAGLRGTETILLVEDEDSVRHLAHDILTRHGYKVIVAKNAGEALLTVEKNPKPISLVLTDVVMPQMSGPEVAKRLAAARPGVKVLYMSGYTDEGIVRSGILQPGIDFLHKPFTPTSLLEKVRQVLDVPA